MTDAPKAAHFSVCKGWQRLPATDAKGLRIRWTVAYRCREAGIDMLHLTLSDTIKIVEICSQANLLLEDRGYVVQLDWSAE